MMDNASIEHSLQPSDQLCFIHIPKSAGSTFTTIIDANFYVQEIAPAPNHLAELYPAARSLQTNEQMADFLESFRLIRGHFSYSDINPLLKRPLYITMLRDPIDRVLSVYEFFKRARERGTAESDDYQLLMDATADGLEPFISNPHPVVKARTSNFQTRQLAKINDVNLSDQELLNSAKDNINQFIFVGFTEQFQSSVLLLSYIFGWYPIAEYQNLRVVTRKSRREGISQDVIDAIAKQNQLDFELYHHAKTIFDQRFNVMINNLFEMPISPQEIQIKDLIHALEQHYEKRYAQQSIEKVISIDFDFRQPISGSGWHRRNGKFNGLKPEAIGFRWTGPSTVSTLDFPLATDRDLIITLHIANAATPDILESLTLHVNNTLIPLKPVTPDGSSTLQGSIDKAALSSDKPFTRLTFTVNRTVSLKSLNLHQSDERPLGVAIQSIQIAPPPAKLNLGRRIFNKLRRSLPLLHDDRVHASF